jgi:hypothetical protein
MRAVPLRIAFDLDGVLADMTGELVQQAERIFGDAVTSRSGLEGGIEEDIDAAVAEPDTVADALATEGSSDRPPAPARLHLTARQQRRLWQHIETLENFWETLVEIEPGAIARLGRLAADLQWEVIFLTKRPASAGATSQVQTQRWLESKGFALPSVYVVQGSRGRIAAALALDFVIDDTPENCLDVAIDSRARSILVWRSDQGPVPAAAKRLGIGVVTSTLECLEILAQLDAPVEEKPRIMERVMRLLGLKEPA